MRKTVFVNQHNKKTMKIIKPKHQDCHFELIDTFGKEKYLGNECLTEEEQKTWIKIVKKHTKR